MYNGRSLGSEDSWRFIELLNSSLINLRIIWPKEKKTRQRKSSTLLLRYKFVSSLGPKWLDPRVIGNYLIWVARQWIMIRLYDYLRQAWCPSSYWWDTESRFTPNPIWDCPLKICLDGTGSLVPMGFHL